jgi:opacity protein-like surface antigen
MKFNFARGAIAAVALLTAGSLPAVAADIFYEPPVYEYEPPKKEVFGGWYLRGHIGMSNQHFDGLDYFRYADPAINVIWLDEGGFGSAPLFGAAVGYQANKWLRGELSAEYRGKASFTALDRIVDSGDPSVIYGINDYRASKSEWLLMANAYADLGDFHGIKPYVGAGIGTSRNTISQFNDSNIWTGGGGFAGERSIWQLAWALHAGVGIQATDRVTVDLGYSYVNLGDGRTAPAENYDPTFTAANDGFTFKNLKSHDFKMGVRYALH